MKYRFVLYWIFLSGSLLFAQSINRESTPDIEKIFDNYFMDVMELNPEFTTALGIRKYQNKEFRFDQLTDMSEAAHERELALTKEYREKLKIFIPSKLSLSQKLAWEILSWHLNQIIACDPFRYHNYLINPMFGIHNNLTSLMTESHYIETIDDAENYLKRLRGYEIRFSQLLDGIKIREEKRIYPPRTIFNFMIRVLTDFTAYSPEENVLYTSFLEKLEKVKGLKKDQKKQLQEHALEILELSVYPAYREFITYLEQRQSKVNDIAGVWKLPNGKKYYEHCLQVHTTTALTPEEVHQIGLQEVKRIRQETLEILIAAGIRDIGSLAVMLDDYWKKAAQENLNDLYYPNNNRGKNQAIKDFKKYLEKVEKKIPDFFSQIPESELDVQPVPDFMRMSMGAHYSRASLDGRRKGVFYVNTNNPPFKPGMQTLALHEGIPGHHFQISLQQESPKNRYFRHLTHYTAYIEGWALYAEKLGLENGWFSDEYAKMGYLNSEMLRAVRLVVDTGIHYKKWTRNEAFNYMLENLGWASHASINRYILWPGQACAYKIGELKILQLRKKARKHLQDKFDIKEFHQAVLEHGAVPLDILDELIDIYIAKKLNSRN